MEDLQCYSETMEYKYIIRLTKKATIESICKSWPDGEKWVWISKPATLGTHENCWPDSNVYLPVTYTKSWSNLEYSSIVLWLQRIFLIW